MYQAERILIAILMYTWMTCITFYMTSVKCKCIHIMFRERWLDGNMSAQPRSSQSNWPHRWQCDILFWLWFQFHGKTGFGKCLQDFLCGCHLQWYYEEWHKWKTHDFCACWKISCNTKVSKALFHWHESVWCERVWGRWWGATAGQVWVSLWWLVVWLCVCEVSKQSRWGKLVWDWCRCAKLTELGNRRGHACHWLSPW